MNTYSRALKHIDIKDVKQKHQQKLIEQKIQRRIEREEQKYIQSVMKDRRVDWRKELNEQMTTSDMFFTTLPSYGDTNLASPPWSVFDGYQYSVNGGTLSLSGNPNPYPTNAAFSTFDTSLYDTLVFDLSVGSGSGFALFDVPATGPYLITSTSGTYSVSLPASKSLRLAFLANGNGNATISNLRFQRRTPMNVFISLSSPEATSFIRSDPNLSNLSPKEKQQKLKEMLEASDEYVMNIFGGEFPGTGAVPPGEYDPYAQILPGEAGDTPGVEIAQLSPADYDRERAIDQMLLKGLQRGDYGTGPDIDRQIRNLQKNLQKGTPGGLPQASSGQDTQIAQNWPSIKDAKPSQTTPIAPVWSPGEPLHPGGRPYQAPPASGSPVKLAKDDDKKKKQQPVVASYEPRGQLISEKRKLKSPEEVLSKISLYKAQ